MKNWLYLILAGFISGIVGGMGMGGGTLLIPVLTIFLSFAQKNAQAINLLVFIPMSIFALIVHIKNKLVDFKVGLPIIITGVFFSIGGSLLANSLSNNFLRKIFGGFLLIVGINQIIQTILTLKKNKENKLTKQFKFRIFIK
ncbi:MAG: sulfite exporter TauE/SafE family protein [Christensenellales bacterium]